MSEASDTEALANLIPLGFDKERDGVANVHEAAARILASDWLAAYVDSKVKAGVDAALGEVERRLKVALLPASSGPWRGGVVHAIDQAHAYREEVSHG